MKRAFNFAIFLCLCYMFGSGSATNNSSDGDNPEYHTLGRQLVEQGRTLVHHAAKRFMIILPAIFFKLGIAFTLLILVTLVAVNNGVIGFMILVVGLSSVLARLQEPSTRAAVGVPYISPLAYQPYHRHGWDRNDIDVADQRVPTPTSTKLTYGQYSGYVAQNQQRNPQVASYYAQYGSNKV